VAVSCTGARDETKRRKEVRGEEIIMALSEERESKNQQIKKVFMSCESLSDCWWVSMSQMKMRHFSKADESEHVEGGGG